ncbi:conserved hypothetical protein [Vibrio harveyi]|uniref:hypothetical protein n=1 Tax=Vibrio TaxID=662 RepID=UPI00233E5C45|nr:hypothetical protein [Vibrio europaeus]MDC5825859.1 hypothetical protein [Vibrio europaeus]CAH1231321.1 conserved hypothetical protein [Vibrio harveyi]CAH1555099.1 conserved hypothetical protein [Vibrio harveyi]
MKLDFEREIGFFENLSNDEQLEILFEDRKNMKRYIKALKMTLRNRGIEDFEQETANLYQILKAQ